MMKRQKELHLIWIFLPGTVRCMKIILLALHHVCRQEEIFLQEECSFWKEAGEAWSRLTLRFRLCCGKKEFLPTSLPIIPIILKSAERITAICLTHGIITEDRNLIPGYPG